MTVHPPRPHMGGADPSEEIRKVTRPLGVEDQVPVIGHEAPGDHAHADTLAALFQQFQERHVVVLLLKDGHAAVATVDHMKHHAALDSTRLSWHG